MAENPGKFWFVILIICMAIGAVPGMIGGNLVGQLSPRHDTAITALGIVIGAASGAGLVNAFRNMFDGPP